MAKRTSGEVTVRLSYSDPDEAYVCAVSAPGEKTRSMIVSHSARLTLAVDCPEMYDNIARSAISFSGFLGYAEVDHTGTAILKRKR